MIIKSMSRKEPSYGQLIEYMSDMEKADEQYNVYQNLYSRRAHAMEAEFADNAHYMKRRKNGVYFYHEILSIKKAQHLADKQQKEKLRDIAYEYVKRRAQNNLAFGTLHDDHDEHLHYHLMISANGVGEQKKTRLSKAEFSTFKKEMENRVLSHYPELEQTVIINREAGEKLSNKGAEQKRRTGKTPERDSVKEKLSKVFSSAEDKTAFFRMMGDEKLNIYVRGNTIGVTDLATGRNHRLKTLGMLDEFSALSERIDLSESKQKHHEDVENDEAESFEDTTQDEPAFDREDHTEQTQADQDEEYTFDDDELDFDVDPDLEDDEDEDNIEPENESERDTESDVKARAFEEEYARRRAMAQERMRQREQEDSQENSDEDQDSQWWLRSLTSWVKNQVVRVLKAKTKHQIKQVLDKVRWEGQRGDDRLDGIAANQGFSWNKTRKAHRATQDQRQNTHSASH